MSDTRDFLFTCMNKSCKRDGHRIIVKMPVYEARDTDLNEKVPNISAIPQALLCECGFALMQSA